MRREQALQILAEHRREIEEFRVKSLAIFGSVARDEAGSDSDVDLLVEFDVPANFDQYMGLRLLLEALLDCRVDLVTKRGLKPRAKPYVERDAVYVA